MHSFSLSTMQYDDTLRSARSVNEAMRSLDQLDSKWLTSTSQDSSLMQYSRHVELSAAYCRALGLAQGASPPEVYGQVKSMRRLHSEPMTSEQDKQAKQYARLQKKLDEHAFRPQITQRAAKLQRSHEFGPPPRQPQHYRDRHLAKLKDEYSTRDAPECTIRPAVLTHRRSLCA